MPGHREPPDGHNDGESQDFQIWARCIAHDLGNLVTLVSCHADLLLRACKPQTQEHRDAVAIRSASRRAEHLLARWLDFHKKGPLRIEPIDLSEFFEEIATLAGPALGRKIRISTTVVPEHLAVMSDGEDLERCLLNLLLNAKDAMGGRGEVQLRARLSAFAGRPDDGVSIEVIDSGPGIAPEQAERIFEPLFTTKSRGSGLGLAMVKSFVSESGGQLAVRNVSESGGACFELRFPRAKRSSSPGEVERLSLGEQQVVLLVEPDPQLGPVLQRLLEDSGYRPILVQGAGEALLAIERCGTLVDAAVISEPLTWMSSEELERKLKNVQPQIQTIALSWSLDEPDDGLDRVLLKPCHGALLLRELADVLGGSTKHASHTRIKVPLRPAVGDDG